MQLREIDIFPPLKKRLKELGFEVFAEVGWPWSQVDVIARSGEEIRSYELKTSFNKQLLIQAQRNTTFAHYSYAVSNAGLRRIDQFKDIAGKIWIGVLHVTPKGDIVEVLPARRQNPSDYLIERLNLSMYTESDDDQAGLPSLKWSGPAQATLERVKEFVRENPRANWKDIFENVPSHYSSAVSLAGSMRQWKKFNLAEFKKEIKAKK